MEVCEYDYLKDCIENNIPISFLKFGDGEHNASVFMPGQNCDKDRYTRKMGILLNDSFIYQILNNNNILVGAFHKEFIYDKGKEYVVKHWESLVKGKKINWVNYHTLIFNYNDENVFEKQINIYKKIKESKRKKIYICNDLLVKSKILLDIDYLVHIPLNNWFDNQFESILQQVIDLIGPEDNNHIVLTSCGIGAKIILTELFKKYPKGIYLDVGSALDLILTKKDSRGYLKYEDVYDLLKNKNFIPENWDSPEYDYIYPIAKQNLGTHL